MQQHTCSNYLACINSIKNWTTLITKISVDVYPKSVYKLLLTSWLKEIMLYHDEIVTFISQWQWVNVKWYDNWIINSRLSSIIFYELVNTNVCVCFKLVFKKIL